MQRLSKLANLRVEEGSAAAAEFRVSVSRFVSWLGQIHQDNVFRRTGTTLSVTSCVFFFFWDDRRWLGLGLPEVNPILLFPLPGLLARLPASWAQDLKPYVSPSRERLVLRLRSDAPPQSQPIVAGTAANTTTTTASPAAAASGAAAAAAAASGGFSFATSTASIGAFDESGLTARDAGGNQPERVLANAACRDQGFFVVPQVVDQDE